MRTALFCALVQPYAVKCARKNASDIPDGICLQKPYGKTTTFESKRVDLNVEAYENFPETRNKDTNKAKEMSKKRL